MTESEGIQAIVNQAAIQAPTALMMMLSDADVEPKPATTARMREAQRQGYCGIAIQKPSFNWNIQHRCSE